MSGHRGHFATYGDALGGDGGGESCCLSLGDDSHVYLPSGRVPSL